MQIINNQLVFNNDMKDYSETQDNLETTCVVVVLKPTGKGLELKGIKQPSEGVGGFIFLCNQITNGSFDVVVKNDNSSVPADSIKTLSGNDYTLKPNAFVVIVWFGGCWRITN